MLTPRFVIQWIFPFLKMIIVRRCTVEALKVREKGRRKLEGVLGVGALEGFGDRGHIEDLDGTYYLGIGPKCYVANAIHLIGAFQVMDRGIQSISGSGAGTSQELY
jgi:hypothetical protein